MTHHLWLPEEDDIVDRHARALARGRYRYNSHAVAACCRDLQSLHRRSGRGWVRTPGVTHVRLKRRVAALGLPWVTEALTDDEERVVQRYVSGLARGDYVRVPAAARQCRDELAGLAVGRRSWHPRTIKGLCCTLTKRLHQAAVTWGGAKWNADEDAVVRRYARMLAAGRLPDAWVAARECRAALIRKAGGARSRRPGRANVGRYVRSQTAVAGRIRRLAREAGWPCFVRPWRTEETVIRDRYVAALVAGRFGNAKQAAEKCTTELERLHRRMLKAAPGRYANTLPRTYSAVLRELNERARRLDLPRYGDKWRLQERRSIERHARGVPAGRYRTWMDAARACHAELRRLHRRIRRKSPISLSALPERSLADVHQHVIKLAHKLGLEGPRRILWTPAENRIVDASLRWYEGHRRVREYRPLREAVIGLQEELDQMGSVRSLSACRCQLFKRRRFLQGAA